MKIKKLFLLITILLLTGCFYVDELEPDNSSGIEVQPGGITIASKGDVTFSELQYNSTHNLHRLKNKEIYTLAAYYGKKNIGGSSYYSSSQLPQLTGNGSVRTNRSSKSINSGIQNEEQVYEDGQINADTFMRKLEQDILEKSRNELIKQATVQNTIKTLPELNSYRSFKVLTFNNYSSIVNVNAILLGITEKALIYVDTRDIDILTKTIPESTTETYIDNYALFFDKLYLKMHEWFGQENDIDGNNRIIILFSRAMGEGVIGYFNPGDKYQGGWNSNYADMFYINTKEEWQGSFIKVCIAHEFQHMIFFDMRTRNGVSTTETWFNEALSAAAEYLTSQEFRIPAKNHKRWMSIGFLNGRWQGLSLTNWTQNNYGYGGIFIRYIIDQYGTEIINSISNTTEKGITAIEQATGEDFDEIFTNFTRALVMSGRIDEAHPQYNPKYMFTSVNLNKTYNTAEDDDYYSGFNVGRLMTSHTITQNAGKVYIKPVHYSINFSRWNLDFGFIDYDGYTSGNLPRIEMTKAALFAFKPGVYE